MLQSGALQQKNQQHQRRNNISQFSFALLIFSIKKFIFQGSRPSLKNHSLSLQRKCLILVCYLTIFFRVYIRRTTWTGLNFEEPSLKLIEAFFKEVVPSDFKLASHSLLLKKKQTVAMMLMQKSFLALRICNKL